MNSLQNHTKTIVFGSGCFWCTEAVFQMVRGVKKVISGYAGGSTKNPRYEEVAQGISGHAEVVQVEYDPKEISLHNLLVVFFASHDPTTKNRQGADVGVQYRSIILVSSDEEEKEAKRFILDLNTSSVHGEPIVTEVKHLEKFYEAEKEHQDYYSRNRMSNRYCELVINPKLCSVQEKLGTLLKRRA
jgi:peptide-methionine (S)-S-oxide reductase